MLRLLEEIRILIAKLRDKSTGKALRTTHTRLEAAGSTEVFRSITIDVGSPKSRVSTTKFASSRLAQNLECLVIKVRGTTGNSDSAVWAKNLNEVT